MTAIKTKRNNAYIRRLHNSDTRKDDATHSMAVTACKSYMGRIYDRDSLLGQDIQTAFVLFRDYLEAEKLPAFTYHEFLCAAFGLFKMEPVFNEFTQKLNFGRR